MISAGDRLIHEDGRRTGTALHDETADRPGRYGIRVVHVRWDDGRKATVPVGKIASTASLAKRKD